MERRFDHMEGIMSQLITMVGKMREEQEVMKQEQSEMKQDISSRKENYQNMRTESNHRHTEVMSKCSSIEADQEFVWRKAVQNERQIAKIKSQHLRN